jgi:hypothetical protein
MGLIKSESKSHPSGLKDQVMQNNEALFEIHHDGELV